MTVITICDYNEIQAPLNLTDAPTDAATDAEVTQTIRKGKKEKKKSKNHQLMTSKFRISKDMKIPDDWRDWALQKGMDVYDTEFEWERFRDHYESNG